MTDRDVYLHTLPMFHCNGWGMPYAHTGMGGPQVVLRKVDGAEILRRIDEHGVTAHAGRPPSSPPSSTPPPTWDGPIPGAGRTRIVVAGAPPPTRTIERVETELGWEFIQIYGLTETTPLLTMNRGRAEYDDLAAGERAERLGRAGAPALGVRMQVDGQGEVLARGNHVLEGYWEQPEATADAIVDGWFHTGDGGTIDDEGYLTISDRKKDVIISGGENVSSIEVEDALFSHPAVAEVARDRRARREVGRDGQGAGGARARGRAPPRPSSSPTAGTAWPTTSARPRSSSGTSWPAPPPASSRSSSCARPTGRARSARSVEPTVRPRPRGVARRRLLATTGRGARGARRASGRPSTSRARTRTPPWTTTPKRWSTGRPGSTSPCSSSGIRWAG